jgi:hypothetical protein
MSATGALTLRTPAAASELGHAVHELVGRQIDVDEFVQRFLASRVYALSPVRPGLFVMSRPGAAPIVPVWSTVRALRQVMGGYGWLACTGADLVAQLPAGVGVLIDDGLPCPIALPSTVLHRHR